MRRLLDALLTTDSLQRARLSQALLAMAMMTVGVAAMHYFVWAGVADSRAVWWWTAASLGGMVLVFVLIRSGWSRRFAEPSLTVPQMVYSITSGAVAYMLVGPGRGGVFPIVMLILMFGMFVASPRQMLAVSLYAVLCFGMAMAWMAWQQPAVYVPSIELGHFILVATMMPAVSILAGRLSRMRHRARRNRKQLAKALVRIRELATRDELTGLINRRHMQELMQQEHQRCVRSGQTFCMAMIDMDHFKRINQAHGNTVGDDVLRALAQEALRHVRVSDVLARWGGGKLVLMMSDTRAGLARGGLDRLRERIADRPLRDGAHPLRVTVSAGLAEHHAGESVAQTLDRAETALRDAKNSGRNRIAVAP